MVIVLKFNVLYAVRQGMLQEMNVVHYETYIDTDHQMATEDKMKMYINNNFQLAEADLHRELLRPGAEVDATENQSVVERRGDLRARTYPCMMMMFLKMMKKKNSQMKHQLPDPQHWRLKGRSATSKTTCRKTTMTALVTMTIRWRLLLPGWFLQIAHDMLTFQMYTDQLHALR